MLIALTQGGGGVGPNYGKHADIILERSLTDTNWSTSLTGDLLPVYRIHYRRLRRKVVTGNEKCEEKKVENNVKIVATKVIPNRLYNGDRLQGRH